MQHYYKNGPASRIFDVANTVVLTLLVIMVIYPLWNQLAVSLNDNSLAPSTEIYFFPKIFTFSSYTFLFTNSDILGGFKISALRVVVGTVLTLLCTGLLAYITTIQNFAGHKFVRRVYIITMYFGGGLIPTYLVIAQLKLLNTFWVYILPGMFNAYYMLLIASYIQNLPAALFEAARIDGATELKIYFMVVLPLSIPVFAAVAVFVAVGNWNAWFDCLIYNSSGKWDTLQVILRRLLLEQEAFEKLHNEALAASRFRNLTSQGIRAATTMIVTVPILVIYPFFQKYFVSGITLGSVKG